MILEQIALAGGLYVPLVFWHFIADWLTQTQTMGEGKSRGGEEGSGLLVLHCSIYTAMFIPVLLLYGIAPPNGSFFVSILALFLSHAIGDMGFVVWFWARYMRRMTTGPSAKQVDKLKDFFPPSEVIDARVIFRPSLLLVIDQLWHLAWLWLIVYFAMRINHLL